MKNLYNKMLNQIYKVDVFLGAQRMRRSPSRNLHNIIWERATEQSADFVENYLSSCLIFEDKPKMWNYVGQTLKEKHSGGICLEFGVAGGTSINWLSNLLPSFNFVGFDSFVGLKEDWKGHHATKGAYSQNGVLPKVNNNVRLVEGWFDVTLPQYLAQHSKQSDEICFIHIDGDTYEAAVAVFKELGSYLKPGMFVLFDELIGYPNWQNGELKALTEAQEKFGYKFEYRAFSSEQALIEIVD